MLENLLYDLHQLHATVIAVFSLPGIMPTGVYVVFDLYFSDESRFCLDYHDGRRRVWRQKNERFKNCCVAEHGAIGDDLILMDDNARHHRARIVNEYLQQETIERMDWPAKSPDLHPIEHAWDILQRQISNRQNQSNSLQELADALVDEWSRIPQVEFQTLIRSFQNRCGEVFRVRGGHTRY
jgi:hypothetical protein